MNPDPRSLDGRSPMLVRGGTVVSMDAEIGDLPVGDVLVENGRITAVATRVEDVPEDAIVVDASNRIVMPGFVDGHRHCWQGSLRRLIPDADLPHYMAVTHDGVARHYRPEDMYIGNLVALLGALNAGFTTVLDLSHNTRSRAHADAVFRAYRDAGIRVVHASAPPNAHEWEEHWPDDLPRLKEMCASQELVTLRVAIDMRRVRPATELMAIARDLGLGITFDGVMGAGSSDEVAGLGRAGLLGPDVTLVHATSLGEEAWEQIARAGVKVVLATTSDEQLGLAGAVPPIQQALDAGIRPGLSVDVEISLAGDMFTQMRTTLMTQRMFVAKRAFEGEKNVPPMMSNADVLHLATVAGAEANGLGDEVGSLTPGKRADLLVIDPNDIANIPGGNLEATIVQGIERSNIRAVFVGGVVRKWEGEVLGIDLDALRGQAEASRHHLFAAAGFTMGPHGPQNVPTLQDAYLRDYLGSHDD